MLFDNKLDWILFFAVLPLLGAGLATMYSFANEAYFFSRQIIWILVALVTFFGAAFIDWRFLRRSGVLVSLYIFLVVLLLILMVTGSIIRGAQSWFVFNSVSVQPADFMKLVLILVLAKYFSRRHVAIAHVKHILISGIYALIPFVLIFLQPDFGSAAIIFLIWLGMIMVSGISKKHLLVVLFAGTMSFVLLWGFGFTETQKGRIIAFLDPLADISGAGYNAYQSTIAVGSGGIIGKGVGYGTQSRLAFLPEYQTDFIFAAFAEEWGFVGITLLFLLFGIVFWRILINSYLGDTNFETLFGLGLAIMFMSHIVIHVGMNLGLLPVTGLTIPFLSYGGSHLIVEFLGLGMLMGMRKYGRVIHRSHVSTSEMVGVHEEFM